MTWVVLVGVFCLGYLAGRWHGVIKERDLLRELVDVLEKKRSQL